jgi:UDPglucose--hexose-1-phosphate uridylyltransferase
MTEIAKLHNKLADGRDLFYFDDSGSALPSSRKQDNRELPERPGVAQMRLDSLTGEWVSVAAHRHGRAHLPPAHQCPLCPTTAENLSELPDNFDVAVFENKSPSFGPNLLASEDANYSVVPNLELGSVRDSIGRCAVSYTHLRAHETG